MESQGFVWHEKLQIYFNTERRKAFSREWVETHLETAIQGRMIQANLGAGWQFFSTLPFSARAQELIVAALSERGQDAA